MSDKFIELVQLITEEIKAIREEIKEIKKLYEEDSNIDLNKFIADLTKDEDDLLPPDTTNVLERKYTLTEWLREEKGILDISPTFRSKLAIMVSQNYKTLKNCDPIKEVRKHKDGRINNGVQVYDLSTDAPILEWSFNRVFLKQ